MLAERNFTEADQARFATVSGDRNPVHLDAVLARRTQAGVPVVHGVHMLLWELEALARAEPALAPMRRLKAQFKHFVAVDESVAVTATRTEASVRLRFIAAGLTIAQLVVDFGAALQAAEALSGEPVPAPAEARDLAFDAMDGKVREAGLCEPARCDRRDVPGGLGLAGSASRRRTRRHSLCWSAWCALGCIPFMPG